MGRDCELELLGMVSAVQIRAMVQQLTLSKISLDDFEEWLSASSWNMHKDSDPSAVELVGKIELILAEANEDADAVAELRSLSGVTVFEMGANPNPNILVVSGGSIRQLKSPLKFRPVSSAAADKKSVAELSYTPFQPA